MCSGASKIHGKPKRWAQRWQARLRALGDQPDLVIAPALGGILVAHEVARALGVRGLFAERQDGILTLRRGSGLKRAKKPMSWRMSSQQAVRQRKPWRLFSRREPLFWPPDP